ncbi:hypothetical protein RR42_m0601 [Cupriavidus basilensis]|uniref:Uncharacterized protein n=1 Tax=Cupriavidus basilensis TaxID=68895 RepID=A0A0C4Y787_9BURK|nr:hypothetical protein RR42_m0601 [Cupriavidus basilensis]
MAWLRNLPYCTRGMASAELFIGCISTANLTAIDQHFRLGRTRRESLG